MKPAPFKYDAPRSLDEALTLLGQYGTEAKLLAGGQSLMPLLNLRLVRPAILVDLNRIQALAYIHHDKETLVIGAMTRQRALEGAEVAKRQPLLNEAAQWIGTFPIRNRGTVGGSLAYGDPAAELPALALALEAELLLAGPNDRRRTVRPEIFYRGRMETAMNPDEILIETRFPTSSLGTGGAIKEVAQRHRGPALVGVVALVTLDEAGHCAKTRLVLFGVQDVPIRVLHVEALLHGQVLDGAAIAAAAVEVSAHLDSFTDTHASATYRREVAGVLTRRALAEAAGRALGGRLS